MEEKRWGEVVRRAYREGPEPEEAARRRLLEAVRQAPRPRQAGGFFSWVLRPVELRVRPVWVGAAAVLLVVLGALSTEVASPRIDRPQPRAHAAAPAPIVQFVLVAPQASRVSVVGDFNGWDATATPMHQAIARGGGATWTVSVPVPPGRHVYAFVLDGERWMADPQAPLAPEDGFGVRSSVLVVGGGST